MANFDYRGALDKVIAIGKKIQIVQVAIENCRRPFHSKNLQAFYDNQVEPLVQTLHNKSKMTIMVEEERDMKRFPSSSATGVSKIKNLTTLHRTVVKFLSLPTVGLDSYKTAIDSRS